VRTACQANLWLPNSASTNTPFLDEQLKDQKYLFAKGLSVKPKMLELERQIIAADGDIEANKGKILSLQEQIAEADVQIKGVRSTQAKAVSEELRDVQNKRSDATEDLRKFEAKAGRTDVSAPQDGTILNMKFFTAGALLRREAPSSILFRSRTKWSWK
jgi:HlyD family secretion protein/epimerase transport system membrane fusion protein